MSRSAAAVRAPLRERAGAWLRVVLSVVKVAAVMTAITVIAYGGVHLYRKYDAPIAVIGVDGELDNVTAGEVETIVADNLGGGFLSLDLEAICAALEKHPWVASASARRKWPNQVVIALEEEVPIARWGEGDFLNNKGRMLAVGDVALSDTLPLLDGPEGQERRVMQQYRNFSQMLTGTGLRISEFRLAPRSNWELTFDTGMELVVGKEPVSAKLERFLLVWERVLADRADNVARIDVRYGNGVAVNWKEQIDSALTGKRES